MIRKIKNFIQEWTWRRILRRGLSSSKESRENIRQAFLKEVEYHHGTRKTHHGFAYYAMGVITGVVLINGAALIYADTLDVPVDHPLYNYKIAAEEVKIRTTPAAGRSNVEVKLAERRVKELQQLEKNQAKEKVATKTTTTVSTTSATMIATSSQATSTSATSTSLSKQELKLRKQLKDSLKKHLQAAEDDTKDSTDDALTQRQTICDELRNVRETFFKNDDERNDITENISRFCTSAATTTSRVNTPEIKKSSVATSTSPKKETTSRNRRRGNNN
jgi:hypothetical protein